MNTLSHAQRIATDATYARLAATRDALGDELDAFHDGALHHAYDRDSADRMGRVIEYKYDAAVAAFHAYRNTL